MIDSILQSTDQDISAELQDYPTETKSTVEAQNIERVIAYLEKLKRSEAALICSNGDKATQIMQHEFLLGDAIRLIVGNDSSEKDVAIAARFKQLELDLQKESDDCILLRAEK